MAGLFGAIAGGMRSVKTNADNLMWSRLAGEYGASSKSGVSVTIDSALRVATVLACVRVLAEGVSQVPLKLYVERADGRGSDPAKTHPVYRLIYRRPNDWQTSFEFREQMMMHAVLCGAAYAYIVRDSRGVIQELLPLIPGRCKPEQSKEWDVTYRVTDGYGVETIVPRSDIMALRGPSWQNVDALSIVAQARDAIGLSIAAEESHARLHSNGVRVGGVLSVDGLTAEGRARLKESLREYQGAHNAHKVMLLDKAATFTKFASTGVEAQHIELRKHQIEEICRVLRVFPHMIGYSDKTSTFASAEAFFLAHVVHSLQPWIERWEQVIARDLLDRKDVDYYAKFSMQGLMRGDAKARAEFYASGIVNGWLTRNEPRILEDLNPIDGLDEPLIPLNMGLASDQAALTASIAETVKAMIGHNGGPELDADELETKIGRVLSSRNEKRIKTARDELNMVLSAIGDSADGDEAAKSEAFELIEAIKSMPAPVVNFTAGPVNVNVPAQPASVVTVEPAQVNYHAAPVNVTVEQRSGKTRKTVDAYDDEGRVKSMIEEPVED